jgi:acyl-CoA thioesterase-1
VIERELRRAAHVDALRVAPDHPHRPTPVARNPKRGRARLPALLASQKPAIVVIELGGNDGLRGGDLAATRANLDAMIEAAQKARAKVLLVGMQLPPNYGSAYTARFAALYPDAAKRHKTALVPFFFEGFGADDALFQPDRIHPTLAAQPRLLDNVWPALEKLLARPR